MGKRYRVQEPIAEYVADDDRVEARLFANGRSQAIRLPKQFRMPGDRVFIHREGERLIVEPVEAVARDAKGHPIELWERIDALMAGEAPSPIEPMPARLLEPGAIVPDEAAGQ